MNADQITAAKARLEAYDSAQCVFIASRSGIDIDAHAKALFAFGACSATLEEHAPEDLRLALEHIDGEDSRKAIALYEIEGLRIDLRLALAEIKRLREEVADLHLDIRREIGLE